MEAPNHRRGKAPLSVPGNHGSTRNGVSMDQGPSSKLQVAHVGRVAQENTKLVQIRPFADRDPSFPWRSPVQPSAATSSSRPTTAAAPWPVRVRGASRPTAVEVLGLQVPA